MNLDLEGRTYLVGGASHGIGLATGQSLLSEGAQLIAVARNIDELKRGYANFKHLSEPGRVQLIEADLTEPDWPERQKFTSPTAGLDGIILTVGSGAEIASSEALERFSKTISTNLTPIIQTIAALEHRLRRERTTSITVVSSIAGIEYLDAPVEYAMAKACIHALVRYLSRSLSPIRVNALAPGNVLTQRSVWAKKQKANAPGLHEYLEREVPQGRLADPKEIAKSLVFLASPASSFTTGETLVTDGGQRRSW